MKKWVCVFCASAEGKAWEYMEQARGMGRAIAGRGHGLVYGGATVGTMGAVARAVKQNGGRVVGVIPEFMVKLEWVNPNLLETIVVNDMHERKKRMIDGVDAVVALPGGSGTLEELMEAITWKRLGLYFGAIVILNTQSYYQPLIQLLDQCIEERFMDSRHAQMWTFVNEPEEVPQAISATAPWSADCRKFAALR